LNHSANIPNIAKSSLPVKSKEERFRYIVSSITLISNAPLVFTAPNSVAMFAQKLTEDSEFLSAKLCLLVEEIFASTLVQSASKLPAIVKACSKVSFSAKMSCKAEWLAISKASSKDIL
jgi:hypothetical protein